MRSWLKEIARLLRRSLKLSPMQKVFRKLEAAGLPSRNLQGLEVFACRGDSHIVDYMERCQHLEMWEVIPNNVAILTKRFKDSSRYLISRADSFSKIKDQGQTRYDLIVVDPSPHSGEHWEFFDLFPHVWKHIGKRATFIINCIPEITHKLIKTYPELTDQSYHEARKGIYGESTALPLDERFSRIESFFRQSALSNGYNVNVIFYQRRNGFLWYSVFHVERTSGR